MTLYSSIPPRPLDYLDDAPFAFEAGGIVFKMRPESLNGVNRITDQIHTIALKMHYQGVSDEDLVEMLYSKQDQDKSVEISEKAKILQKLKTTQSLVKLTRKHLEPIPFWKTFWILFVYNLKYWYAPRYWVWSLSHWLERHIPPHGGDGSTLFRLLSYFVRYSTEQKKNIFLILQKGIGNLTKDHVEQNQTKSHYGVEEPKPDCRSIGAIMYGSQKQ